MGGVSAAGINELCEDATGDYYDLLMALPGGRIGVAVGDVSGHGLQAALVMAEARAFLRAFVQTTETLPRAMDLLNDCLVPDMAGGKFMSLFTAVIDSTSGAMEWCNAGHNPPLLYRAAESTVEMLEATGRILGILPDADYRAGEPRTLRRGDVLLLYTDGITESRNGDGELYETDRLEQALRDAVGGSPEEILAAIRADVRAWTGGQPNDDDLTMLAVSVVP
jgi:sigma-B regulation protein RsbU (phosphoserine phosphatase)